MVNRRNDGRVRGVARSKQIRRFEFEARFTSESSTGLWLYATGAGGRHRGLSESVELAVRTAVIEAFADAVSKTTFDARGFSTKTTFDVRGFMSTIVAHRERQIAAEEAARKNPSCVDHWWMVSR
jgi:hypothetical protein